MPSDERRSAGVNDVDARFVVDENRFGSENRTLFDRLVDGVLTCMALSETTRGLTGDTALLRRFGLLNAMGTSKSELLDAIFYLLLMILVSVLRYVGLLFNSGSLP